MQDTFKRPDVFRMRLDIGFDKIEERTERSIAFLSAHGLDIDAAARLGAVTN